MSNNYKPGGGNKPQPYIPAGNGEKSGEYTNKNGKNINSEIIVYNCNIRNTRGLFNYYKSSLVKNVLYVYSSLSNVSIPRYGIPNSVVKKIINLYIETERYYNEFGEAYLDIDYTCHGNPKTHPFVPHIHRWIKNEKNELIRKEWEEFK